MAIERTKEKLQTISRAFMFSANSFLTSPSTSWSPAALQAAPKSPDYTKSCLNSNYWCFESPKASCSNNQPRILLHILLILLQLISGTFSINVKEIRGPHPCVFGRPATLECLYETDRDNFYSIRWYLNGEQFYSFIKRNDPEKVNHNHKDVVVEMESSDTRKVTISTITAAAEGQYRCEVMGEAPLFPTDSTTQNFSVVRLPDKPEVRVMRSSYRVGEVMEATCTARHSWPASRLSFSVNGKHISAESNHMRNTSASLDKDRFYFPKGSFTSTGTLILPLGRRFSPSHLRLGCHAHVQSLKKDSYVSVKVESGISGVFSLFNAGVAYWTADVVLVSMTLVTLLVCQIQL